MIGTHKTASSKELGNERGLRQRLARFFVNRKGSTMTGNLGIGGVLTVGDSDNYTQTAADGTVTLAGTARVWKDMVLNPETLKLPGSNPPSLETYQNFPCHRYDKATEESVYYVWAVPHEFAVGDASVKGHYAFLVDNPPAAGGNVNVRMGFEYKKVSDSDVFTFAAGTTSGYVDEAIVEGEAAWTLHKTPDGTCTTTGWATDDIILFRFFRKAADAADTYDDDGPLENDVWVLNYHLAYLVDKFGVDSA